jgi:hypothetical protein
MFNVPVYVKETMLIRVEYKIKKHRRNDGYRYLVIYRSI